MCVCALEGRGREWGAKPGESPSEEKAAIVQAGQLPGPAEASREEAEPFLLCVQQQGPEERGRGGGSGGGDKKNRRRKESREAREGRGLLLWAESAN